MPNPVEAITAQSAVAVTASDITEYAPVLDAVFVGGAGDIAVVPANGSAAVVFTVPAGAIIPLAVKKINSTDTTATNIVGLRY